MPITRVLPMFALGLLVTTSAWAKETLVLSCEVENAWPGEEGVHFREDFYTDDEGRLVHRQMVRLDDGARAGDISYEWSSTKVSWTKQGDPSEHGEVSIEGDSLTLHRADPRAVGDSGQKSANDLQVRYVEGSGICWQVGAILYQWNPSGTSRVTDSTRLDETGNGETLVAVSGACATKWPGLSNYPDLIIYDRRPQSYMGTYWTMNENLDGHVPTGYERLTGPGLWSPDKRRNLIHLALLVTWDWFPAFVPFVVEDHFLR